MYKPYDSKIEIMIRCFLPSKTENGVKKRKSPSDKSDTTEKRTRCVAAIEDKLNEVKKILAKLHGNKYSVEQYHAWAQLIQIGKQELYDKPPNFPFFVGRKQDGNKRSSHIHGPEASTHATTSISAAGSTATSSLVLILQSYITRKAHKSVHRVHSTNTKTGRVVREW